MRPLLASLLLTTLIAGCTDTVGDGEGGGAADIQGEDKADGQPGIEVTARIAPGTVDAALSVAVPRRGYVFYAAMGTKVTLETTHGGTSPQSTDTVLKVYGPRLADGTYPVTLASDEDSGYGKLSRIKDLQITIPGFYLVEVAFGAAAAPADGVKTRLQLTCSGTCESPLPIQPIDEGLKWYRRSAERRGLSLQSYAHAQEKLAEKLAAGVPASWGVVLDIDETTLDNSAYQQARLDLGVGYSPGSWTEWVNQKAAKAIPGVAAFTEAVHAAGGKVVLVSNRKAATECPQTVENLAAVGVSYDDMLCKTDVDDKNPRFAQVETTQHTIIYVGDNIQDFPMLTQDLRKQDDAAYAKFGEDYFLIPNSMYGSFDKNPD